MPPAVAVHVLVASSHVTVDVQVNPQLHVEGVHVPKLSHWLRVQNDPLSRPASADAPHSVPLGAYAPQKPVASQDGPQIGSPNPPASRLPPGSVPAVAIVHVPTFPGVSHAWH